MSPVANSRMGLAAVAFAALGLCGVAHASGASVVLDAPDTSCFRQVFPIDAGSLDALIPVAAQQAGFSVERATSHGHPVWLGSIGMSLNANGEYMRIAVTPINAHSAAVCYFGVKKNVNDPYENPTRVWQHFMAWLATGVFDVWSRR